MALAQIYSAVSGDTITAARWNNEFGNLYNNGTDVAFPLTKAVSFAGYTVTVDAAGVTTITSPANSGFLLTVGAKSGAPGANGSLATVTASTFTDSSTLASATAALWTGVSVRTPTLVATSTGVVTTDASTVYIEGPPTAGANQTLTNPWALHVASGNTKLGGDVKVATSDARTNTVDIPATISSVTSGSAAAGIGTGLKFQAESADETESDFGQIQFEASDVTAASEDTFFDILTRRAGAALASAWKMAATTAFRGTLTQGNSADRIYTFPDAAGTVIVTGQSNVGTSELKSATGSSSGSLLSGAAIDLTLNDYSFFPNIQDTGAGESTVRAFQGADSSTTVSRFTLVDNGTGSSYVVRWRYITASDNPVIWVVYNPATGILQAVWVSDDPIPGDAPGIIMSGFTTVRLVSKDLESMSVLTAKAQDAQDYIADNKMKAEHQAYRSLQLTAGDAAPSKWILDNCTMSKGKIQTRGK